MIVLLLIVPSIASVLSFHVTILYHIRIVTLFDI